MQQKARSSGVLYIYKEHTDQDRKENVIFFNLLVMPLGMWDLRYPTRDGTHAPCIESIESFTHGPPEKTQEYII